MRHRSQWILAMIAVSTVGSACASPPSEVAASSLLERGSLKHLDLRETGVGQVVDVRVAADAGNARARTLLGLMFSLGRGVPHNQSEAIRWFRLAARDGECAGQYHLGLAYLQGEGVPLDVERASYWLRRVVEHQREEQTASFEALYGAIRDVTGAAIESVISIFEVGSDAAPTPRGEQLYHSGIAHLQGGGVPVDDGQAVRFFRMAASEGYPPAQRELGLAYQSGRGARRDPVRAHMWLNIASASGDREAASQLAALETRISESDRREAEFAAAEWFKRRSQ